MPQIDVIPSPGPVQPRTSTPPKNEPPPTPEELQAAGQLIVDKLFGQPAEPVPEVVKPAAPAAQPAETPAAQPPAAPPVAPREPTTLETIQQTARATAEAVADRLAPAPASQPAAAPALELTAEDQQDLKVLQYMAKSDPGKYGSKPQEFLDFVKKAYAYQDEWLAAHADQEFKWEDTEHAAWWDQNSPEFDRDAMDDARVDMRAEEKWQQKMQPILEKEQAEKAWEKAAPEISNRVVSQVVNMVDMVNPELAKLLRDDKGRPDLRPEAAAKVDAADPIAYEVCDNEARFLIPLITELEKTGVPGLNHKLDARNPVHRTLLQRVRAAEEDIANAPPEDQMFGGKRFATVAEMQRLRNQIESSNDTPERKESRMADLEATRTCLTIEDLVAILTEESAARAKAEIERRDAVARKKYGQNLPTAPKPPEKAGQPPPREEPLPTAPPSVAGRPPILATGSELTTPGNPAAGGAKSLGEQVTSVLFK